MQITLTGQNEFELRNKKLDASNETVKFNVKEAHFRKF